MSRKALISITPKSAANSGSFKRGNTAEKRRKRRAGGRPTKKELEVKKLAGQIFREIVERKAKVLGEHYVKQALKNDRVLINAADKLWPESNEAEKKTINIAFIQFNSQGNSTDNHNPAPVYTQTVSTAFLAANSGRHQTGSASVAPASWQRQNGTELHDQPDVSGKRRKDRNVLPLSANLQSGKKDHLGRD